MELSKNIIITQSGFYFLDISMSFLFFIQNSVANRFIFFFFKLQNGSMENVFLQSCKKKRLRKQIGSNETIVCYFDSRLFCFSLWCLVHDSVLSTKN